ncbi:Amino acid transporter, transmembrane family-containing protein [Aphelenchoides fujianensis]|nr:Amino acid transporter, transmembrane family-containing protein [Aphelenchoides fujianensis]
MSARIKPQNASNDVPLTILPSPKKERAKSENSSGSSVGEMKNGEYVRGKGLHWITAALIMVGDMAGGSVKTGFIICALITVISTISAIYLGICWRILVRNWPEYREHTRKPYAEIAGSAIGPLTKLLASLSVNITQFGIVVVYFLLSARNIHDWLSTYFPNIPGPCVWVLVMGAMQVLLLFSTDYSSFCSMYPFSFLKSPEDFWLAIVASMLCTLAAVVLVITGSFIDYDVCHAVSEQAAVRMHNVFLGMGTVVFAWGGHSTFPSIQHDMRKPRDFTYTSFLAFSIVTIMANPLQQEAEELFKISQRFGVQRVLVRSGVLFLILFVAESVPNFGPVIDLLGASTFTLTGVIFPSLFYCFLHAREQKLLEGKDEGPVGFMEMIRRNKWYTLLFTAFVFLLGAFCGTLASVAAVGELVAARFQMPCYLRFFFRHEAAGTSTSTNCCGVFQNVTVGGHDPRAFCNAPNLRYYG